jgi:hypothetical protein
MPKSQSSAIGAIAVACVLSAQPLAAQAGQPPESAKVPTLATVTVTGEPDGNWFVRAVERRQTVVDLAAENRRLRHVLRSYDGQVARLETRLDSLKGVEASKRSVLSVLDDSIAATRARRAALERRLADVEARTQPPPR